MGEQVEHFTEIGWFYSKKKKYEKPWCEWRWRLLMIQNQKNVLLVPGKGVKWVSSKCCKRLLLRKWRCCCVYRQWDDQVWERGEGRERKEYFVQGQKSSISAKYLLQEPQEVQEKRNQKLICKDISFFFPYVVSFDLVTFVKPYLLSKLGEKKGIGLSCLYTFKSSILYSHDLLLCFSEVTDNRGTVC